jgi:RNA-directed DNA polymerase
LSKAKPIDIPKRAVWEAWKKVRSNRGGAGIDEASLSDYESDLENNLYKLWNRLSSGSYFPPAVRVVEIPKSDGKKRRLGIPTVSDRIAQTIVKSYLEPRLELIFHKDSYGYRPNKSAIQAVGEVRERSWKYDWVLEFDIRGAFDNINHDLLLKAIAKHTSKAFYIWRWC